MGVRITEGGLSWDASIDDTELNRVANRIEGRVGALSNNIKKEGASLEDFGRRAASAAAGYLSIQAASGFVKQLISVRGQFEQLDVAFTTILKSKAKADALMGQVVELAATTPFSLSEVATSAKQLLAYGFAADQIKDTLTSLGDVAAGVSAPIGEIAYLYGTLRTQGRAYSKDIQQFSGRGIPIIAELAKQFGVAEEKVMGLVEAGQVGFKDVEKAFQSMTGAGGIFFHLMEEQSKTLTGRLSNLGDAFEVMLNEIGEANSGILYSGIAGLNTMVENYQKVIDIIGLLVATYGTYKAVVITTAAFEKVSAATRFGVVVALNEESVARAANAAAMANEMRVEVSALAIKKTSTLQAATAAAAELKLATQRLAAAEANQAANASSIIASVRAADAKAVQIATDQVQAAQEKASITRKAALSASTEFYTAKTNLETTAKAANAGITLELTAAEGINAAGKRILTSVTAAYNAVLAASPMIAYTAVIVALGSAIYALTQANNTAAEAQKGVNKISEDSAIKVAVEKTNIEEYIAIAKDKTASHLDQAKAIKKLNEINPEFLGGLNAQNIATAEGRKLIDEYLVALEQKALGELAYAEKQSNIKKIIELNTKGIDAVGTFERVGTSISNLFTGKQITGSSEDEAKFIVKQKIDALNAANKEIDAKYGKEIKDFQLKGIVPDATTTTAARVRNEQFIKDEIEKYEKLKAPLDIHSKAYKNYVDKITELNKELSDARGKVSGADKKAADERLRILEELTKAEQEATRKGLTKNREEIKAAQDKFDEQRKDARAAGLGKETISRIDNLEVKVTGDLRYSHETEKLKTELDKQRDLFASYEEYKLSTSKDAADKRFDGEKAYFDNYGEYLKNKMLEFSGIETANMTGEQEKRYDALKKESESFAKSEKEKSDQRFIEAIQATQSYENEKLAIEQKYQKMSDALLSLPAEEYVRRKAELDKQKQDEIDVVNDTAFQKSKIYAKLNEDISYYTQEQLKIQINSLEEFLKVASNLPPELKAKLQAELATSKGKLGKSSETTYTDSLEEQKKLILDNLNKSKLSTIEYEKQRQKLAMINAELKKASAVKLGQLSGDLGDISSMANELSSAFVGLNDTIAESLSMVGQLAGIGSSAAGAGASFASGDILGGITQSITAVTGVVKLISSTFSVSEEQREAQKRATDEYYRNVYAGEKEYARMMRARQSIQENITELTIKELDARKAMLSGQSTDAAVDYDESLAKIRELGEKGKKTLKFLESVPGKIDPLVKSRVDDAILLSTATYDELEKLFESGRMSDEAKALFLQLRASKEEIDGITQASKEAEEALSKIRTGTTAEDFTKGLFEMFKTGKTGTKDFADYLENTLKDALYSVYENDYLNKAIADWYKEYDEAAKDGITPEEKAALAASLEKRRSEAEAELQRRKDASGLDFSSDVSSTTSNIKGSIQRELTEQTGSELTGLYRATYDLMKRQLIAIDAINISSKSQLTIFTESLDALLKIEQNTANTVVKLDEAVVELKNIVTNTKPGQSGRGLGVGP